MSQVSPACPADAAARGSSRSLTIRLYGAAVFLYWAALYLYMPTLPTYVESKSGDLALVGVVLSMYGLWQAIIRLPVGIAADWFGRRRPFILVGFGLAGLGALTMGMAKNVNGLLIGRAITGLAAGTWVPLVVLFSALFPPEEAVRASSLLTLIGSGARVLATSLTGSLNELGGYSLAFLLAAGAAVLAILMVLPSRERLLPAKRPSLKGVGALLTRRDVLLPSLISMVAQYGNWAATFSFVPILAQHLGATGVIQSMLIGMNNVVFTVGNLLAATVVEQVGARRLVYASLGLLAVGVCGAACAPSLSLLFLAQLCIGAAQGVGYPVLMGLSIRHVAGEERAVAMGLHQSVYAIGMFSGPAASGLVAKAVGIRPMLGVTGCVCLLLGIIGARRLTKGKAG